MWPAYGLAALVGYLLGSFPTGYLVGRAKGMDIREHGSKNIGATNVVRVLGKGPGFLVFGVDALKGWLAVSLARLFTGSQLIRYLMPPSDRPVRFLGQPTDLRVWTMTPHAEWDRWVVIAGIVAAVACILGHNFPVWLRFRGGKGIATSAGVLLGLVPLAVAVGVVVWLATFYALRYVSVASLLAAVSLPVTVGFLWHAGRADGALFAFSLLAAALAWWRHRANLQRLLAGTEPRFAKKKPA